MMARGYEPQVSRQMGRAVCTLHNHRNSKLNIVVTPEIRERGNSQTGQYLSHKLIHLVCPSKATQVGMFVGTRRVIRTGKCSK
jgi:hypothetical protein